MQSNHSELHYKSTNLVPLVNLVTTLDNRRTLEDTAPSPSPEDITT